MQKKNSLRTKIYNLIERKDEGFTLLEVLIAVIILAVACIPVLHAFATSANTTSKATVKMYATNAAENVMESTRNTTIEEFVKYWGTSPSPAPGTGESFPVAGQSYSMQITDAKGNADIQTALDKGYTIDVEIDPSFYKNTNSVNLSQFDAVSSDRSAIYCMDTNTDSDIYSEFEEENERYRNDIDPGATLKTAMDFKSELKREIRVDISKTGSSFEIKDKDGNNVLDEAGNKTYGDEVIVDVSVNYYYVDSEVSPCLDTKYKQAVSREIFNNKSSHKELRSIFILYNPRYEAAHDNGDIIIVHNHDNVEANLYIVAQKTDDYSSDKWDKYVKEATGGLMLQVYEDKVDYSGTELHPLILRTNLINESDVDFNRTNWTPGESEQKPVKCFLNVGTSVSDPEGINKTFDQSYTNIISATHKGHFGRKDDAKALRAEAIDGKTLDSTTIKDRLYDVRVKVSKTTAADEWPISVEFTGTMLE